MVFKAFKKKGGVKKQPPFQKVLRCFSLCHKQRKRGKGNRAPPCNQEHKHLESDSERREERVKGDMGKCTREGNMERIWGERQRVADETLRRPKRYALFLHLKIEEAVEGN